MVSGALAAAEGSTLMQSPQILEFDWTGADSRTCIFAAPIVLMCEHLKTKYHGHQELYLTWRVDITQWFTAYCLEPRDKVFALICLVARVNDNLF